MKTLHEALEDLLIFAPSNQFGALTDASIDVQDDEIVVIVESGPHEGLYKVASINLEKVE